MWVNNRGERFADESTALNHYESVNALLRQPGRISYALFDEQTKQRIIADGPIKLRLGVLHGLNKEDLADIDKEIRDESGTERVKISDSWDEIAAWIGASSQVLRNEIDNYNRCCDAGHDSLFAKDRVYLWPLRTSPYYAVRCRTTIIGSLGGIKIDHTMQVLDQNDIPIRGLYAAGTDAGGWESDTYNAHLSGTALGFPLNSGRIAGENAVQYVNRSH
jgi:fumarate reductase flavoprotein subunit